MMNPARCELPRERPKNDFALHDFIKAPRHSQRCRYRIHAAQHTPCVGTIEIVMPLSFAWPTQKIRTVYGDDLRLGILFGQDNERGIVGVHRGILEYQFLRAGEIFGPRAQKSDGSIAEQAEQGLNGLGVASQIRTGFAKHINGPPSTIVRTSIALACGEVRGTAEHRAIWCG